METSAVLPLLPPLATRYEARLEFADSIELALVPLLHPGRYARASSIVENMGAAVEVNYTTSMTARLWSHFNGRRDSAPVPVTHKYLSPSDVLYVHPRGRCPPLCPMALDSGEQKARR